MKRGRPKLPARERKTARVTLRLSPADARTLATLTVQLATSESAVIRYALRAFHLPEQPS
jgi:hypothetical protein